jgi:hypothetical protein
MICGWSMYSFGQFPVSGFSSGWKPLTPGRGEVQRVRLRNETGASSAGREFVAGIDRTGGADHTGMAAVFPSK